MRTPAGGIAEVLTVHEDRMEALVRWPNGQHALFRLSRLTVIEES